MLVSKLLYIKPQWHAVFLLQPCSIRKFVSSAASALIGIRTVEIWNMVIANIVKPMNFILVFKQTQTYAMNRCVTFKLAICEVSFYPISHKRIHLSGLGIQNSQNTLSTSRIPCFQSQSYSKNDKLNILL
jgi:hypothetical protein